MTTYLYRHDFDSVGGPVADVRFTSITKTSALDSYSIELGEDESLSRSIWDLWSGRPRTWSERADELRIESTVRRRIARRWRDLRVRFAHWAADEFVGHDGWEA